MIIQVEKDEAHSEHNQESYIKKKKKISSKGLENFQVTWRDGTDSERGSWQTFWEPFFS